MTAYLAGLAFLRAEDDPRCAELTATALCVLAAMASFARETTLPECYASQPAIARRARVNVRTLRGALSTLVKAGVIANGGKRGKTIRWQLSLLSAPHSDKSSNDGNESRLSAPDADKNQTGPLVGTTFRQEPGHNPAPDADKNPAPDADNTTEYYREEPSSSEPLTRPDVERLCKHLRDWVIRNGSKPPTITKAWRDAARLMLDRDKRTEDQIMRAIDWCQTDTFWRANVRSMPKLREQYDTLRLHAERERKRAAPVAPSNAPDRIPPEERCPNPDHRGQRKGSCSSCAADRKAARRD